eukprot:gene27263-32855_t
MSESDLKNKKYQADGLRTVAFFGVALSTIATLICVISVPMFYNYMQHMQSVMQNEVDFCKSRSGNIWREVTRTQTLSKINGGVRVARSAHSKLVNLEDVAVVVFHLMDHQVYQDYQDQTVKMEAQDHQETKDKMLLQFHHETKFVNNAKLAHQLKMEHQVNLDHQDQY